MITTVVTIINTIIHESTTIMTNNDKNDGEVEKTPVGAGGAGQAIDNNQ